MCMPSPKIPAPIIPPSPPRMSDESVSGARDNLPRPFGYAQTVLTGALAPASTRKTRALGATVR